MKRAFSLLAAIILILTAGCEKQSEKKAEETKVPEAFSSTLEISSGELSMTAKITQSSFGNGKIKMLSPKILEPLEMTFVDEKCEVAYDSLKFESNSDRFPQVKIGSVLIQILAYIGTGVDVEKTIENGIVRYSGSCEHGVFILSQNSDNGNLTEFTVENMDLHIKFKDFNT